MTATREQAVDDILGMLLDAWTDGGLDPDRLLWPNKDAEVPSGQDAWGRATLQHTDGGQGSLAGDSGKVRWTRVGILTVQVFVPSGEGLSQETSVSKIVMDAFEGKKSARGVWFRRVRAREIGPDGQFFQTNVIVEFEYDEIK